METNNPEVMLFTRSSRDSERTVEGFLSTHGDPTFTSRRSFEEFERAAYTVLKRKADLECLKQALKNPNLVTQIRAEVPPGAISANPSAILDYLNEAYRRSESASLPENNRLFRLRLDIGLLATQVDEEEIGPAIKLLAPLAGYQAIGPIKFDQAKIMAALQGANSIDDFCGLTPTSAARVLGGSKAVQQVEHELSDQVLAV